MSTKKACLILKSYILNTINERIHKINGAMSQKQECYCTENHVCECDIVSIQPSNETEVNIK